jgi:hypothetical protein
MSFNTIWTDSCKKHISVHIVICLLPIPRPLVLGSFVSLTESEFAFHYLPGPFLVFILRSVLQHCLRPGVFTCPVFVVSAAIVFVNLRWIFNLHNPRGYFTFHQVYHSNILCFVRTVLLCVLYGSQHKLRMFPCTG